MPFNEFKLPEELWKERRQSVRDSLATITVEELRNIVKKHEEEFVANPARDEFLRLMEEQPHAGYYTAVPQEDVVLYYCSDAQFGVWVLEGSGIGPLDAEGKRLMKEAIEGPLPARRLE